MPQKRRPLYPALGEFRPGAHQPIRRSAPKPFTDNDGVPMGAPDQQRLESGQPLA